MEPALPWTVLAWLGAVVLLSGWFDLALLWYPPRFGSPEWEFGTVSAHFDGMPLGTLGLGLLAAAAAAKSWRIPLRVLAVFAAVVCVGCLAVFVIYLLNVPVAWQGVAPQMKRTLATAIIKACGLGIGYIVAYAWFSVYVWRRTRK